MRKSIMITAALLAIGTLVVQPALAQDDAPDGKWHSGLSLGFNLTDGNSETTMITVGGNADRKTEDQETLLKALYSYGENTTERTNEDGTTTDETNTTTDNFAASAQHNLLINDKTYGYVKASYLYDDIADVDYRVLVGPGLGQYLVKSDKHSIAVEVGLAYLWDKVGGEEDDALTVRFAERSEHQVTENAKVYQSVEYLPELEDFDVYLLNIEAGIEVAMNSSLSLRVALTDKYDSDPAPGLEENDLAVNAAIVYTL